MTTKSPWTKIYVEPTAKVNSLSLKIKSLVGKKEARLFRSAVHQFQKYKQILENTKLHEKDKKIEKLSRHRDKANLLFIQYAERGETEKKRADAYLGYRLSEALELLGGLYVRKAEEAKRSESRKEARQFANEAIEAYLQAAEKAEENPSRAFELYEKAFNITYNQTYWEEGQDENIKKLIEIGQKMGIVQPKLSHYTPGWIDNTRIREKIDDRIEKIHCEDGNYFSGPSISINAELMAELDKIAPKTNKRYDWHERVKERIKEVEMLKKAVKEGKNVPSLDPEYNAMIDAMEF
ncbi:MAG: hypothetical protein M1530_00660 [Candidatus Marsarchaeota archaeon]|nr:hypothetical protein [Candidatus Marsarchaeota archaeon]